MAGGYRGRRSAASHRPSLKREAPPAVPSRVSGAKDSETAPTQRLPGSAGGANAYGTELRGRFRYRLLKRLGRGSFGSVYLARCIDHDPRRDDSPPERVAVKILRASKGPSLDMLRRELAALLAIQTDRIPRVFDWSLDGERAFVVMQYFPDRKPARRDAAPGAARGGDRLAHALRPAGGARRRAPRGGAAPRHQARQRAARPRGRLRADGLRRRAVLAHAPRPAPLQRGHARLPGARAEEREVRRVRPAHRPVRARRHGLGARDRHPPGGSRGADAPLRRRLDLRAAAALRVPHPLLARARRHRDGHAAHRPRPAARQRGRGDGARARGGRAERPSRARRRGAAT